MERFAVTGQEDRDPRSPLEGGLSPLLPDVALLLNPQSTCVLVPSSSREPKQDPSRSARAPGSLMGRWSMAAFVYLVAKIRSSGPLEKQAVKGQTSRSAESTCPPEEGLLGGLTQKPSFHHKEHTACPGRFGSWLERQPVDR